MYELLHEKIKQAAKAKAFEMAHGGLEDYAQYKEECGVIKGLNLSLDILDDVLKEFSEGENN